MPSSEECIPSQHHQKLFAPTVCHWQRMEIHRILFPSRSHSSRSLLLYKTHVFLEMMMRKSKSSRASFLIVPCTALQWPAHQSCLQLEQNNIVTAATAPKRRKDFSRFSILVHEIEGESSLKSPLNCQRKAELLSFSYRSNLPSYSVIHKLTLNSWVFLKTSYLPVPQDSSLAGKLEISNFKFLRWSDCFLRFVRLWHCRKNNRGRERFLIRYPV